MVLQLWNVALSFLVRLSASSGMARRSSGIVVELSILLAVSSAGLDCCDIVKLPVHRRRLESQLFGLFLSFRNDLQSIRRMLHIGRGEITFFVDNTAKASLAASADIHASVASQGLARISVSTLTDSHISSSQTFSGVAKLNPAAILCPAAR